MRRGTTPTLTFTTPYEATEVASGYITFTQRSTIVLDLNIPSSEVTVSDNEIAVQLTQAQTLQFDQSTNAPAQAQIRLILTDGNVVGSNIVEIPICAILKDGEI